MIDAGRYTFGPAERTTAQKDHVSAPEYRLERVDGTRWPWRFLGPPEFRDSVKMYTTDVDEGIPPNLPERYVKLIDCRHVFREGLRRPVNFGRNDLLQDAPISRIDLNCARLTTRSGRA
jgi:hypothetical protein